MSWDNTAAIEDFETLQLAEFGESVIFINGTTLAQTRLDVVRPTVTEKTLALRQSTNTQLKAKVEILVSRGSSGKATIRQDIDKFKLKVSPDDAFEKTLLVRYVMNEYGAWRVGLA